MSNGDTTPNVGPHAIPLLIGHLLDCLLHGVFIVQIYSYFVTFPDDRRTLKLLVLSLFLLENAQTGLVVYDAITTFGLNFGNVSELDKIRLQWLSVPVLSAPISCSVQLFFANRVRILSQKVYPHGLSRENKIIPAILFLLSLTQGVASLVAGIPEALVKGGATVFNVQGQRTAPVIVWLSSTCLCDIAIAASMLFYLKRGSTDAKDTRMLIQRIKRHVLETGAATAGVATATLILWLAVPSHPAWTIPASVISKIYSNSLLASLISREAYRVQSSQAQINLSSGPKTTNRGLLSWSVAQAQTNNSVTSSGDGKISVPGDKSRCHCASCDLDGSGIDSKSANRGSRTRVVQLSEGKRENSVGPRSLNRSSHLPTYNPKEDKEEAGEGREMESITGGSLHSNIVLPNMSPFSLSMNIDSL
ncbi:hypothetical protein GYMLUDRAFT_36205 [Collybiopsis luxurians FD-317 M1]|nr:hypothetical protein GYMLUDRAFT_36205 [Collybiopsis luxurians FD-317 M1]